MKLKIFDNKIYLTLFILLFLRGVFSSVGLERYLDRVEVTGSNPVLPTKKDHLQLVVNSLKTTLETTLEVLGTCDWTQRKGRGWVQEDRQEFPIFEGMRYLLYILLVFIFYSSQTFAQIADDLRVQKD